MKKLIVALLLASSLLPAFASAAVGFDTSAVWNFIAGGTCSGSDATPSCMTTASTGASATLGIIFFDITSATAAITSCTWNGAAMTVVTTQVQGALTVGSAAILSPSSGAQTVQCAWTGGGTIVAWAGTYLGTDTATLPSNSAFTGSASAASVSKAIVTTHDNAWVVNEVVEQVGNTAAYTAGATRRCGNNGCAGEGSSRIWGDTNAAITPAGSHTDSASWTGSGNNAILQVEIFPPATTAPQYDAGAWFMLF